MNINPGAVTTFAGSGASGTADGTGTAASFTTMGNSVVVGGFAYVGTSGAIRKVDLSTGAVTTFAGAATTGCTDSASPTLVRFNLVQDITTDGTYLFATDTTCGIRKLNLSTGASSTINTGAYRWLTLAGTSLYATASSNSSVFRIDPVTGTSTSFATLGGSGYAITSDATDLWVTVCMSPCGRMQKVSLSTAAVTTSAPSNLSLEFLTSAGSYLYSGTYNNNGTLVRISKADGSTTNIAGTNAPGYADGTGTDAWFSGVRGLSTDGTNLWASDRGNFRLRKVSPGTALPASQSPLAVTTVSISPGAISTFAGNGQNTSLDGTGNGASFAGMTKSVVVGGFAYVGNTQCHSQGQLGHR